jgi:hypothetical protein
MEAALVDKIASTGNIAVLVLLVVVGALYKLFREERALDRAARAEDVKIFAAVTERQTAAVQQLTQAIAELRFDTANRARRSS